MAEGTTAKKPNYWVISTFVLGALLVASVVFGGTLTGNSITADAAGKKTIDFINNNLVQPGTIVTLVSTRDLGTFYEVTTTYQGQDVNVYTSKDGKMMFLSDYIDMSPTANGGATSPNTSQPTGTTKSDKPTVQLFVMSFCPYGQQAEKAMKPVFDLLGDSVTIEPHFIVSVSGTTVNSLHGQYEVNEDMRQAVILKHYGNAAFWKYVDYVDNKCTKDNIDTCWKDAAKAASIDTAKVEGWVTSEGLDLMKAEAALANQNGVSGSPTLIINGVVYDGDRTADAYKQGICDAFTTAPAACSQALSATANAASGNCG
jgi:glutaredoxin